MAQKGPGRANRKGVSLAALLRKFPDNATAERWFARQRWGNTPACPYCESINVQTGAKHKTMPYRCREKQCAKRFSVKIGTAMQSSNLGYQTWAIAIYLVATNITGVSSLKLHRNLNITQKSAWHLAYRIQAVWALEEKQTMKGPAKVDKAFFGDRESNKHTSKKLQSGRGPVGATPVVGVKGRETSEVLTQATGKKRGKPRDFVERHTSGTRA